MNVKVEDQLEAFRGEMNKLDAQICEALLLRKRMSRHIQRWKVSHQLPCHDLKRETEIVQSLSQGLSREQTEFLKEVYACILRACLKKNQA